MRAIVRALETTEDGTLTRLLPRPAAAGFSEEEARAQLDTAIDWGRYAELFDYHADDDELVLTAPANESAA